MRCAQSRKRIQHWFDTPVATIPPDIAEHVKVCLDCRNLITRWNAIELKLQALRDENPPLSQNFTGRLRARLRAADSMPRHRAWPPLPIWRFAIAGMGAGVLLLALLYTLFSARLTGDAQSNGSALAVIPTTPSSTAAPVDSPALAPGR